MQAIRKLDALGLNRGSTGNLSLRCARGGVDGMLITPTGMGADDLRAQDMVWVGFDGTVQGDWLPSSEWHFHQAILLRRRRPAGGGAHAFGQRHRAGLPGTRAAALPLHGGGGRRATRMPCMPYHTFGSRGAVGRPWRRRSRDRNACLLAHHGLVAAGATLAQAMKIAIEIESLCEVYLKALAVAEPARLERRADGRGAGQVQALRALAPARMLGPGGQQQPGQRQREGHQVQRRRRLRRGTARRPARR